MTTTVLTFFLYLGACYGLGFYLVARLRAGRRVSQRVVGKPRRLHTKPLLSDAPAFEDDHHPTDDRPGLKHAA
ncbi:MAG: hypothetical protein AAGA57_07795 [Planctomycetota bacterium]